MRTSRQTTISRGPRCSRVIARFPTMAKPAQPVPTGCRHMTCGGVTCQSAERAGPSRITASRPVPRYCGKSGRPLSSRWVAVAALLGGETSEAAGLIQRASRIGTRSPVTPRKRKSAAHEATRIAKRSTTVTRSRTGAREANDHQSPSRSRVTPPIENRVRLRTCTWELGQSQTVRLATTAIPRIHRAGDQRMRDFSAAGLVESGAISSIGASGLCGPVRTLPRLESLLIGRGRMDVVIFLNKIELQSCLSI